MIVVLPIKHQRDGNPNKHSIHSKHNIEPDTNERVSAVSGFEEKKKGVNTQQKANKKQY
jgi:hypothetical protein